MKIKLLTFFGALFVAAFVMVAMPNSANAQGAEAQNTEATEQTQESTSEAKSYTYIAQAGDSYSVLARKAIQTYGIETKTDLSGAQIVYVETNLTLLAGSPELNEGQEVKIAESTVKDWVEKAKDLSAEEQAAWDYYVQFVNFDTSKNGES